MSEKQRESRDMETVLRILVDTPAGERIRMKCGAADLRSVITDTLALLQQPTTSERCGECEAENHWHRTACSRHPRFGAEGKAQTRIKCDTDDPLPHDGSECEYSVCPRPRVCFHYCEQHHKSICAPPTAAPVVEAAQDDTVIASLADAVAGAICYGANDDHRERVKQRLIQFAEEIKRQAVEP